MPALSNTKSIDTPTLLDFKGNLLTVQAQAPLPPGSRVENDLPLADGTAVPITGKIVSTTPMPEGAFKLVIRVNSLLKTHQDRLLDIVSQF